MNSAPAILAFTWPIHLEYFSGWDALGFFALLAIPIVWLGIRSLAGLGRVRKWVAIGIRLLVLLVMILILGGIRIQRRATNLEVMVLRDISQSTANVNDYPGQTLQSSLDQYLTTISQKDKPPDDKIGQISFQNSAMIDALPNTHLSLESHAIRNPGTGTDTASAIQLGLATLRPDAMHRMLLIWDGNATQGDTAAAVAAAVAQHVPIDVMPLHYDVQHEVLMDRFVAPTWKRENEPFTLDIILKSTNSYPVTGKLTVLHQGVPMDLDPAAPGVQPTMPVALQAGLNPFHIKVPALQSRGVHQFHASFEADANQPDANVTVQSAAPGKRAANAADTLTSNNSADAFTFVQGKGQVLYVDNVAEGRGETLRKSLNDQGIEITAENHITPDQFPTSLIQLENYDAVILANVSRGPGGLSEDQQRNLTTYVHDMGGGLVMIGGPDTFGAGGWQGSKLEEVLPVNMDIPAQRQIPKGALVLVMHSCEMPDGNYYGEQCAIKAIETLSSMDEIGIVSYGWGGGGGGGGSQWDFPLGVKGDGSKPIAAAKKMQLGDMPSFEDSMTVALNGSNGNKGLKDSNAKQKHVIIISDGDPQGPSDALVKAYLKAKVTVSTVTIYPHMGGANGLPPVMDEIAHKLHGKAYGPITSNPNQLPQIFIKEATVVRRSLIVEDSNGIPLKRVPSSSDMVKGMGEFPPVKGMVLTSRKNNPQIEIPIVAGANNDPVLAHWQTGLGKVAVYTSDANNTWGVWWVGSPDYDKFWAQVVRAVSRPPMSSQFDIQTTQSGDKGHIVVEALDKSAGFLNFLNIAGKVAGPDPTKPPADVRLVQTGPGRYEATFDTPEPGTYVAAMEYRGQKGVQGMLLSGVAMNSSPELRDLQSNDAELKEIAERTNGRVLPPFNVEEANLFTRENLAPAVTPLPVWDILLPILVGLILIDVATRRIAWDWVALKRYAAGATAAVRSFTTTRKVETRGSLDALKRVREEGAASTETGGKPPPAVPNPQAKFTAPKGAAGKDVEGDITQVVGGASNKPIPPPPKKVEPKGAQGETGGMSSLMEAKRRAQQQIREKEQREEQ
jgi:uncharacterized membrane protein